MVRQLSISNPATSPPLRGAHFFRAIVLDALGRSEEAEADLQPVLGLPPPTHELSRDASRLLTELGFDE